MTGPLVTSPQPALELVAPGPDPLELEAPAGTIFGAAAEGVYGAAVSAGTFRPVPVVSIGADDLRPDAAGVDAGLVVVDGVTIRWGRDDVLEQPTPATGQLRVLDLTNRWATATDRRGQLVTIRWEGTTQTTGTFLSGIYFRGRIGAPITVSPVTVAHPTSGELVQASVVELPLQSILVDLANRIPTAAWPAETLGARADRVQAEAVAAGALASVIVRDYWRTVNVGPVPASEQVSILAHLEALYDSCGVDRMTYVPSLQRTENLIRRGYTQARGLVGLSWDAPGTGAARDGQGIYARSHAIAAAGGVTPGSSVYLDSAALEYDPADGLVQPTLVTLARVTHPDEAAGYADRTTTVAVIGTNELVTGRRTASLESIVSSAAYADVARNDLESIVRREGSAWQLQPLRYSTRKTGGFERSGHAQWLLFGAETNTFVILQRSFLPNLGVRPVFGVMGSTITFARGGWDIDINLAPMTTDTPQHAITWEEIDDGSAEYQVEWWDDDNPRGMHESLTYEDLGYIATGLNVPTTGMGPNTGWDTII